MKKIIALFGSLLILGSSKSRAQKPQQPVKKETVKPTNGAAPKTAAVDNFLIIDGKSSASKASNPAYIKGAHPVLKSASTAPNRQPAPRQTASPANRQAAPRHK